MLAQKFTLTRNWNHSHPKFMPVLCPIRLDCWRPSVLGWKKNVRFKNLFQNLNQNQSRTFAYCLVVHLWKSCRQKCWQLKFGKLMMQKCYSPVWEIAKNDRGPERARGETRDFPQPQRDLGNCNVIKTLVACWQRHAVGNARGTMPGPGQQV